jgi:hypothetical protein
VVVVFAIVPDQLDVVERLLHEAVLLSAQFVAGCAEVHGVFDDEGVVGEAEGWLCGELPFQSTGDWNS